MKGEKRVEPAVRQSMNVTEFKHATRRYVERATSSAKSANTTLEDLGIYTRKGNLTKPYRR
jgi:hypothetical protein